jgi:hypothetical protein
MKSLHLSLWLLAYALSAVGCTASVWQSDDSVGIEVRKYAKAHEKEPMQLTLDLPAGTRNVSPQGGEHEKSDSAPIESPERF